MNEFWMDSEWWEYVVVAIAFCFFPFMFWFNASLVIAIINKKKFPKWLAWLAVSNRNKKQKNPRTQSNPEASKMFARCFQGFALLCVMVFFIYFEIDLWKNVIEDHATVERALLLQLTLFLPLLLFNFLGLLFFERYLKGLPERPELPYSVIQTQQLRDASPLVPSQYLPAVIEQLEADGFHAMENVKFENYLFRYVAKRTRFELKYGGFTTTYFMFSEYKSVDINVLRSFSSACVDYAMKERKMFPPGAIFCYSIAMVSNIDELTANSVREEKPPFHRAVYEIPVICDISRGELIYFEKSPFGIGPLWEQIRERIPSFLVPDQYNVNHN